MHGTVSPSRVASPSRVRFDASLSRPVTEISPLVMTSVTALSTSRAASAAGSGAAPGAASGSGAPAACGSTQADARAGVAPVDAGSADGTAVIAVQPRADVTLGIERVVAERAGRPA